MGHDVDFVNVVNPRSWFMKTDGYVDETLGHEVILPSIVIIIFIMVRTVTPASNCQTDAVFAQALPANFTRFKKGNFVIRQEVQRLFELDLKLHPSRPILTSDGRTRLKDPVSGEVVIGLRWTEILDRASDFFSCRYVKERGLAYGKAVHEHLVRIAKQLSTPPHLRTELGLR